MAKQYSVPLLGVVDSHFCTKDQAPDHKAWMLTATILHTNALWRWNTSTNTTTVAGNEFYYNNSNDDDNHKDNNHNNNDGMVP